MMSIESYYLHDANNDERSAIYCLTLPDEVEEVEIPTGSDCGLTSGPALFHHDSLLKEGNKDHVFLSSYNDNCKTTSLQKLQFCTQLTKANVAETSCNQLLINLLRNVHEVFAYTENYKYTNRGRISLDTKFNIHK